MEIYAASLNAKASLGQGYDTARETFVGQCVRGTVEYAGNQESQLAFDRSIDETRTATELGFQMGAKARYGLFSGSLAAKFASESSASEFADVTIYSHSINFRNAKLVYPGATSGLTPVGLAAKGTAPDNTFVGDQWPLACGHEYVSQITLGAKLLVAVKVEFSTREDKRSFSAEFQFSGPPVEVQASLNTASKRYGKRASLSIHAYQMGGDVRRLPEIFGTESGHAPILMASLDNPEAVLQTLDNVVKDGRAEFPRQINPNISLESPIGPAQLSYLTSRWDELGLFSPPAVIQAGVTLARRQLSDEFEKSARYQRRLSRILNGPVRLSPRQLDRFKNMQRVVSKNLALIQEAAAVCYSDFMTAPAKVAEIVPQLKDYIPEEFEVQPESFAQWYDMKDLPGTLQTDKKVIDDIAGMFIPTFNDFAQIEDKGLALQRQLSEYKFSALQNNKWFYSPVWSVIADSDPALTELTIMDRVTQLEPLAWTKSLRKINFTEQSTEITDISPIAALTELTDLKLRGRIESLTPLANSRSLIQLEILDNAGGIRDLSPLASVPTLRTLRIDDGAIHDVSALAALQELEAVGLSGSPIRSLAPLVGLPKLKRLHVGFLPTFPIPQRGLSDTPIADTKLFGTHPLFSNLFVVADRISISESTGSTTIWTRRGDTNLFDTVSSPDSAGDRVEGVGAFAGVMYDEGRTLTSPILHHVRAGKHLYYTGKVDSSGVSGEYYALEDDESGTFAAKAA